MFFFRDTIISFKTAIIFINDSLSRNNINVLKKEKKTRDNFIIHSSPRNYTILLLWIADVVRERELDGRSTIRSDELNHRYNALRRNLVY